MNINKCFIGGNLTRDPELKTIGSGQSVCNFSIASNRKWLDKAGEKQEDTTYFDCVAWAKTGENIAKFFGKGKPIFVIARATNETWDDKETGQKRSKMKFVVEEFQFVGGKGGDDDARPASKPAAKSSGKAEMDPDSIPF